MANNKKGVNRTDFVFPKEIPVPGSPRFINYRVSLHNMCVKMGLQNPEYTLSRVWNGWLASVQYTCGVTTSKQPQSKKNFAMDMAAYLALVKLGYIDQNDKFLNHGEIARRIRLKRMKKGKRTARRIEPEANELRWQSEPIEIPDVDELYPDDIDDTQFQTPVTVQNVRKNIVLDILESESSSESDGIDNDDDKSISEDKHNHVCEDSSESTSTISAQPISSVNKPSLNDNSAVDKYSTTIPLVDNLSQRSLVRSKYDTTDGEQQNQDLQQSRYSNLSSDIITVSPENSLHRIEEEHTELIEDEFIILDEWNLYDDANKSIKEVVVLSDDDFSDDKNEEIMLPHLKDVSYGDDPGYRALVDGGYQCTLKDCDRIFLNMSKWTKHADSKVHDDIRVGYVCYLCKEILPYVYNLNWHVKFSHSSCGARFDINLCPRMALAKSLLKAFKSHKSYKIYHCLEFSCDKIFTSSKLLVQHMTAVHSFECKRCGFLCPSQLILDQHMQSSHFVYHNFGNTPVIVLTGSQLQNAPPPKNAISLLPPYPNVPLLQPRTPPSFPVTSTKIAVSNSNISYNLDEATGPSTYKFDVDQSFEETNASISTPVVSSTETVAVNKVIKPTSTGISASKAKKRKAASKEKTSKKVVQSTENTPKSSEDVASSSSSSNSGASILPVGESSSASSIPSLMSVKLDAHRTPTEEFFQYSTYDFQNGEYACW